MDQSMWALVEFEIEVWILQAPVELPRQTSSELVHK
jgi:hypothetical protein